ncbi:TolC family protein [Candidatus Anaplasma sp. TIGMIC]|uniref:TolC family protein n=1 Tax=Candidatus Anaplasma sp. TIGMIC TaxID=3020713 RepID=UPI002330941F|nr:TolC family protein [Candidatus Anaplasma sp. TIGMIC]MDB1135534.1 TolC family protein [Candidatus Anaplasma sp. TIGMIC]
MRKALLIFSLILMKVSSAAHGTSLDEALNKTLANNMAIKASLCKSLASKREIVNSAVSGILPQVVYELKMHQQGPAAKAHTSAITLTQPMFNGAAMFNVDRAKFLHTAQDISFALEKQRTLLSAIKTYMNALTAYEVDRLNEHNVKVMQEHLLSAEKRFAVGEITKTELAKAKAKLAQAKSEAMSARGRLRAVEANYAHIVGEQPVELVYPKRRLQIPGSLEEALEIAKNNNLSLKLSQNMYQASKREVAAAVAKKVLPTLHLSATESFPGNDIGKATHRLDVQLRLPIFDHGVGFIDIDRTHKTRQQHLYSMHEISREIEESVVDAWEELVTAKFVLQSARESVKYTEVALEAITQEAHLNLKTTLDVLDIEQELLKAKVRLINSQSNLVVSQYTLLALLGQFTIS